MTPIAPAASERAEAARLAHILLRFASAVCHAPLGSTSPGSPRVGVEAWVFSPSWVPVMDRDVEQFLIDLPCPTLLAPALNRGSIHLWLIDEMSGDRLKWAKKTISNMVEALDSMKAHFGLEESSRVLLELEDEIHDFPLSVIRYWLQHFCVELGWNLDRLDSEPRAVAVLKLMRADGKPFPGRSSMMPPGWRRSGAA